MSLVLEIGGLQLTAGDRYFLAHGDESYRKSEKLTDERKAQLQEIRVVEPAYKLGMDSHGAIQTLCIFEKDGRAYAFGWEQTSEESFFEEAVGYEVVPRDVTVTKWFHPDGRETRMW